MSDRLTLTTLLQEKVLTHAAADARVEHPVLLRLRWGRPAVYQAEPTYLLSTRYNIQLSSLILLGARCLQPNCSPTAPHEYQFDKHIVANQQLDR